jgi:hypothetical protein
MTREEAARAELEAEVRALAERGDGEAACRLAADNWRQWFSSGDIVGGRRLLATALGADGPPSRARALALYADGVLAFRAGDQAGSSARNEAGLKVARQVGDKEAESLALVGLSRVALRDGDYGRVCSLAADARELAPTAEAEVNPLHMLAVGTRLGGDLDAAADLYAESADLNRRLDNPGMVGMELHNLGHLEIRRGNVDAAKRHFADCRPLRDPANPYDSAMQDLNDAALSAVAGDRDGARGLVSRAEQTLEQAGIVLDPDDQSEVDWLRAQL